ncbi:MAG: NAD(+) synthase [Bacilli bacterium]|nr:NAD(+) synthase [Bacilli bacterium]
MKHKIIPITELRNTSKLDKTVAESDGPIFVTKNGHEDFVVMSQEHYDKISDPSNAVATKLAETPDGGIKPIELDGVPQDDPLGLIRVGCAYINVKVAGVRHNAELIKTKIKETSEKGVKVLVFQELTLTGYTCGDLFLTKTLINEVDKALQDIVSYSAGFDMLVAVGAPMFHNNALFNCAIIIHKGEILGVVPKYYLPNYAEFYEKRHFQRGPKDNTTIVINGKTYPFGNKLVFFNKRYVNLKIGVEICEDAWVPDSPSIGLTMVGANLILNLSASNETIGKDVTRRNLVLSTSARLYSAYAYADAGIGESTTDLVYGGHQMIAENGEMQAETPLFSCEDAICDIDIERLVSIRSRTSSFVDREKPGYVYIGFDMELKIPSDPIRKYMKTPFLPEGDGIDLVSVKKTIDLQAYALASRIQSIRATKAVIGLSGGLDSTLALLVAVEAFKILKLDLKGIYAITMPAFGTSKRTHDNAVLLADSLGVSFKEINVKEAVIVHLRDLGHDSSVKNNAYENAQARERTQVLMDFANDINALMIGTGDLSELCLGWCTYGGDHMSFYGVNGSIPKTLVRYLCKGYSLLHKEASKALDDIIDTPISPELLPTDSKGAIAQETEDIIGPYILHDFFIFHFLKYGYRPKKIFFIARIAFKGMFDDETIKKWLRLFFKRFFQNQFKRSCLPDGPKIAPLGVSPRGDLRMPSDASSDDYLAEIDTL